jgi:long-subunit fatty acid transport protein
LRRTVYTSILVVVLCAEAASAQTKTGTTVGQFMGIEPSGRIAAMGNAGVALSDGIQCIYYNPAAAAELDRPALQFTHGYWFADIGYDYAAGLLPVGRLGNLFASVTTLQSGDIDVRTVEQPLGTGEHFDVQDVGLGLGWGRQFTARFGAGVQVNYLSETIWHSSMHTVTVNAGTIYRLTESGLALGSSLSNFGTRARFSGRDLAIQYDNDPSRHGDNSTLPADQFTDEFPVPILFRVGMSYPRRFGDASTLQVTIDACHPSDNTESISAGGEWSWKDTLSLRAGYQNLYQRDSELGLTAGIGLRGGIGKNRFQFDYAWAYHSTLNETHRLTFALTL